MVVIESVSIPIVLNTQYATPTVGQTVNISPGTQSVILEPAGALLTLTVNFNSGFRDGDLVTILCSTAVTTLTLSASTATILGGIAAFAANGFARFVYKQSSDKWFRCG